jgi:hypothetical protein
MVTWPGADGLLARPVGHRALYQVAFKKVIIPTIS